ncbi:MAG TPA: serine hydrolase [Ktedonobacterales bacterium]|jgi:beta-lactamase class A
MYYREAPGEHEPKKALWQSQVLRRILVAVLVAVFLSGSLLFSYFLISQMSRSHHSTAETLTTNGASRWVGDTQTTAPAFEAPAPVAQSGVDPLFQKYYNGKTAAHDLGAPLTPAFPIHQGWIQFFASGALLLPAKGQADQGSADEAINSLISSGLADSATGVVRLPLIQALLTVGSKVGIGGENSTLTYVGLRSATDPALMVPGPEGATSTTAPQKSGRQGDVFIAGGTRNGKIVGHIVPAAIWSYLSLPDVSPNGWQKDFGAPLTEALNFTAKQNGSTHHLVAQVFWRNVILLDHGVQGASSQGAFAHLDAGLAYLRTLGPPAVALNKNMPIWALGDTTLLSAAGTGQATVHIGQQFPLTLVGDASWVKGALWYQVQWKAPKTSGNGWAPATALTFTSPGNVPGWASFDVLSSDLAQYLASLDKTVAAVVYDITRLRYYTYNMDGRFITGSSMKVTIMLTFLNMTESEGREPNSQEMQLLTTMIENSDNDSASTLYFKKIGGAAGVSRYLQEIGVTGLEPNPEAWGYSTISPLVMTHILTLLQEGKILTQQDRDLAFNLMEHIESDQRFGVGDTAPKGATVAMKNGWLRGPGPNGPETGLWAVNSSGIVMLSGETYIVSVYTAENNSFQDGKDILHRICSAMTSAMV